LRLSRVLDRIESARFLALSDIFAELLGVRHLPRFGGLVFPAWVNVRALAQPLSPLLLAAPRDAGERAAIALAAEILADAVLIDEAAGRRIAAASGLATFGVL
jgi:predicted nucleic acid-binding protein